MTKYFEKEYELRYFEMNKFGVASPTTILTLLEETAAEHCLSIGVSLYDLEKQRIGWVLISGAIEMIRYPKYKEKITIKTWLSKYSIVKGYRENIIYDEKKNIIGKAKGLWLFYDITRRRPIPISEVFLNTWSFIDETSVDLNIDEKIVPVQNELPKVSFNVFKLDIDGNNHVNNIRYLHWLIESLPEELLDNYYLKSINGRFVAEAKYGEKVQVFLKEERTENTFLHSIESNMNATVCAVARTVWCKY